MSQPASKPVAADHPAAMARGLDLFKADVRAILVDHCLKCHGGASTKGDFDLTTREALLEDLGEGPSVIPGDSKNSRLYKMVAHLEKPENARQGSQAPRRLDQEARRLDRRWAPPTTARSLTPPSRARTPSSPRTTAGSGRSGHWPTPPSRPPRTTPGAVRRSTASSRSSSTPEGAHPQPSGRPPNPDPPGLVRPRRPAADARGGRGVRQRPVARRLREGRRSAPGEPELRRALGAALARPRPVRREPRLRARLRPAHRLPLPRLRRPGLE